MAALVDPAFKSIPRGSSAFLIWRIENMQVVPLPKQHYGTFYEGDSYIVYAASELGKPSGIDVKVADVRGPLEVHIHFWLGAETSTDEAGVAAYKTVELDDYLGGTPIQHRETQGNESARFKAYFKSGFTILKGGVASGLHEVKDVFEPRLFRIKGRRSPTVVQQPAIKWEYFNSGDVFIIHTKYIIFVWTGRNANNMEKIQAAKVALKLKSDFNASSIEFVDDGKELNLHPAEKKVFSDLLNIRERSVKSAEEAGADEAVEESQKSSLTLYHCSDEEGAYKITEIRNGPLNQSDLNSNDSFIIDNGSNGIWVWIGKKASTKERIEALANAHGFVTKKGYPPSTPVTRVVDGGEPVEFKMLFTSWKEKNQTTGLGKQNSTNHIAVTVHTKLDASTLHEKPQLAAKSQLVDDGSGTIKVWRVNNFNLEEVPQEHYGMFFSGDSYVVHYQYNAGGSEKHIIYYWLGLHSPADEQGTAALKTVELDDSFGGAAVQVRVNQGKEPAHFLTIFQGQMLIFSGGIKSSFEENGDNNIKQQNEIPHEFLLQVRGNSSSNTKAVEVPLRAASLNSNDVFFLKTSSASFIWCGKGSTGDEREMAKKIADVTAKGDYTLIYEGQEKADFWDAIGGQEEYSSDKRLAESNELQEPRLFQLSNASGSFRAEEVMNFQQIDLIPEDIMLLDARDSIYLWVGKDSNAEEQKLAIQTALEYLATDPTNRDESTPIIKIKQGFEPPTFTGFFGVWDTSLWNNNKTFREICQEIKGQNEIVEITQDDLVDGYRFEDYPKYPLDVLCNTDAENLPDDVDKLHREMHLAKDEFESVLGMSYADFAGLPQWKQNNLKKAKGLF